MSESSSAAARLELVTIPDCRLCDRAREALTRLAEQRGQVWAERDLTELGAPDPMWWEQVPLVLVPTSYPQLSFAEVAALDKVGLVICGNHAIRAAVAAMRDTFARILAEGGIAGVEGRIASVQAVFALQGDDRMREIEQRFLR